uniref:Enhancer of polycomb-like protein n=1 Tax=Elaeis guineensis var. tenera TaxID=51953 RepID=A0A6I9QRN1_ELAGV|nr:uncharacterized protein LOC105039509 isoform X3 [Elaeis guineensis]
MSRLSFRPRPLDIHKKLPIVKSIKDFEDDDAPATAASTRNSQLLRLAADADNEQVHQTPGKKSSQEIPTPQFSVVATYERDYARTFAQPTSYLRARGARAEIGEFVEYDLDDEDEDWLEEFNKERKTLTPEKFETLLFKLEVLDHKIREKAGVITPTFVSPIPVLLKLDAAAERERWQKPILRCLQPPPPVNDTNPYNVFRPREKAHRLHTRRIQRRENNVQSFEKLRQVRRNLDQVKTVLEALIKREEKKREVMECEINLQRIQLKYKHEAQLVEDRSALPGFIPAPCKFGSREDDLMDSDDATNGRPHAWPTAVHLQSIDYKMAMVPAGRMRQDLKRAPLRNGWLRKMDPNEPVLLFARGVDPDKLAAAGIVRPPDPSIENGSVAPPYRFHGRIGRGGRIIFDRWNPLLRAPLGHESSAYVLPSPLPPPNG